MNAQEMSNRELLTLLVGPSVAKALSGKALAEVFGLSAPRQALLAADVVADYSVHPTIEAARVLYVRALAETLKAGNSLSSPSKVREYLVGRMKGLQQEIFVALWLDARHRLIRDQELFRGTLMQTSVYPREVVKAALAANAGAVVFAHNHPSGALDPSQADELLTRNLKEALAMVDVKVLDHFIVAENQALSMAERGLI